MAFNHWCKHRDNFPTCLFCNKKGQVQTSNNIEFCPQMDNHELKLEGETCAGIIGPKMTIDQIRKDRTNRSRQDFKKNILPTLAKEDQQLFKKKYPKDVAG